VTIALIGLDYRTAPLEIREKLALAQAEIQASLSMLDEMLLLVTCNRMEIYFVTSAPEQSAQAIIKQLTSILGLDSRPFLYHYEENHAAYHLMRLASGLESMILGESQILGQLNQVFEKAQANKTTGAVLSHLFSQAIHAGKRARHETEISRHTTSLSHAAVKLLRPKLTIAPEDARVLVVGAGEMARLAAQALQQSGIGQIAIINRSADHAQTLAETVQAKVFLWEEMPQALTWADALITAVTAPHPILSLAQIETIQRPIILLDLAMPRNIEANVQSLEGMDYSDIDAIQSVIDNHLDLRKAAIPDVQRILEEELIRFNHWYQGREVAPTIIQLREWAQAIAQEELEQALSRLGGDERSQEVISLLAHRLTNRFLHEPTTRLRLQAVEGNGANYAQALRELFALEEGN
jgi:glutamyl-tRNA reductase